MAATLNDIIQVLYTIYLYMIIIYSLMSWIPNLRESFVGELLGKFAEPYLAPFRKLIPPIGGFLDVSPIVAIFCLHFVKIGLMAIVDMIFG